MSSNQRPKRRNAEVPGRASRRFATLRSWMVSACVLGIALASLVAVSACSLDRRGLGERPIPGPGPIVQDGGGSAADAAVQDGSNPMEDSSLPPAECRHPKDEESLAALYEFDETSGDTIHDTAGVHSMDLAIDRTSRVSWSDGQLVWEEQTIARTDSVPKEFLDQCKKSGALTVEVWIAPDSNPVAERDPARIVTMSKDSGDRNFTLGVDDNGRYVVRLRTSDGGDDNGLPELRTAEDMSSDVLQHVVWTHSPIGEDRIYVDGEVRALSDEQYLGDFSNWEDYRFALGNEIESGNRGWLGAMDRVAVYCDALSAESVAELFACPPMAPSADGNNG